MMVVPLFLGAIINTLFPNTASTFRSFNKRAMIVHHSPFPMVL
ncbi:hypothetical protein F7731_22130 [Cytobacillus depressus]|uniref:Uncharacterized protein n=1 Tax=Cytobacillus depressus TaxID=1602942 RepID=A0A6L3V0M7_9BACI|nr:hypothetical protein F7731_22130 [Cytobacillus depressus]